MNPNKVLVIEFCTIYGFATSSLQGMLAISDLIQFGSASIAQAAAAVLDH